MADIIDFHQYAQRPDPHGMDRDQLAACLETVRAQIAQLDETEPEEMESEEYEAWGDRHEELEDLADELLERLEKLGGPPS